MVKFTDYLRQRQLNEMGYMILQHPIVMHIGHRDEPIPVKMFDMRYEDYMPSNSIGQYHPVVAKIPGTSRNYLVWDGDRAVVDKLDMTDLADLLTQEKKLGSKSVKYTMLPDNWYQYAVPVD